MPEELLAVEREPVLLDIKLAGSYLFRDRQFAVYEPEVIGRLVSITPCTAAGLLYNFQRRHDPSANEDRVKVQEFAGRLFKYFLIPQFTMDTCLCYAQARDKSAKGGDTLCDEGHYWNAAFALQHEVKVLAFDPERYRKMLPANLILRPRRDP